MRSFIVAAALLLSASAAMPEGESPFLKDAALDAEVARDCKDGCLVLSPVEAELMMRAINAKLHERELAAFEAGKAAGAEIEKAYGRCRT